MMAHAGAYLRNFLLMQKTGGEVDVRDMSTRSMDAGNTLAFLSLSWTQIGWVWAFYLTHSVWLLLFAATDFGLCLALYMLRIAGKRADRGSKPSELVVWASLLSSMNASLEIFMLAQVPSHAMAIFAIMLTLGCCAYVTSLYCAFPVLATTCILI